MKVIDLLNKIASGEKVPKKIKYNETLYEYNEGIDYENEYGGFLMGNAVCICPEDLNEEVEIIEESQPTKEEIKEYTNKFLEVWTPIQQQFGKLFDELIRIKNDLGLNLEDNIKEEPQEHKIPEKIEEREIEISMAIGEQICVNKINEIIDYLEEIE